MSLLDDVSIVVTPNGYKAGELYAVVPAASLGNNVIVNGDFATDSDWNKGTGWTISGGSANCDGNQTGATNLTPNVDNVTNNTVYKTTYTISNYVSGSIRIKLGNTGQGQYHSANGTYTEEIKALVTTFPRSQFNADVDFKGSIDNVLVEEVISADMDVTRATAATRVDEAGLVNYAEIIGSELVTNGSFTGVADGTDVITLSGWNVYNSPTSRNVVDNKLVIVQNAANQGALLFTNSLTGNYKFTVDVSGDTGLGGIYIGGTGLNVPVDTYVGKVVFYFTASSNLQIYFRAGNNSAGKTTSYTNISVKEVTRDNVPRIDYSGGGCPHILAEPQRTNLITTSEDFNAYTIAGSTVTPNSTTAPDGTNSGVLVTQGSSVLILRANNVVAPSTTYTFSGFFKSSGSITQVALDITDNGSTTFNLTSEWQRFSMTSDSRPGGSPYTFVDVAALNVNQGDTFYAWGLQVEEGSYATSYIPTSGSTVTRNQDIFTRDGISSLINSTEGVLFAEIKSFISQDLVDPNRYITLTNGTSNERVALLLGGNNNQLRAIIFSSSQSINLSFTISSTDTKQFNKLAIKYKSGDYAFFLNGTKIDSSSETNIFATNTLNNLSLDVGGGTQPFRGMVKQLQVYKTALTDEQLIQLTGESGTDFYESYAEMASALTYTIQ